MIAPSLTDRTRTDLEDVNLTNITDRAFVSPVSDTLTSTSSVYISAFNNTRFEMNESVEKREWTEILVNNYIWRLFFTAALGLIGISDLLLLLMNKKPILHWFNDVVLIIGAIGLTITTMIRAMNHPEAD